MENKGGYNFYVPNVKIVVASFFNAIFVGRFQNEVVEVGAASAVRGFKLFRRSVVIIYRIL